MNRTPHEESLIWSLIKAGMPCEMACDLVAIKYDLSSATLFHCYCA